jgi:serine protease Do
LLAAVTGLAVTLMACGGSGKKEPTPTAGPVELTAAQILEKDKTSIVSVVTNTPYGEGGGTGIVFEDSSHVLTNAHVVIGAGSIKIVDPADSSKSFAAKVVALSACDDVALLSVDRANGLKPATFGDSSKMQPGEHVVSLGFPGTLSSGPAVPIVTEGTVSRVRAEFDFSGQNDLIQNTAPINPGNSGGPLYNKFGEVIGLNSYSARGSQQENYAISSNEALAVASKLKAGKSLDYIGISVQPNYEEFAYDNDLAYIDGLVVMGVDPGSAADKAQPYAIEPGYLIFDVNNTPVYTTGDFCDVLRSQSSGATLRLRFGAWDNNDKPYANYIVDVMVP